MTPTINLQPRKLGDRSCALLCARAWKRTFRDVSGTRFDEIAPANLRLQRRNMPCTQNRKSEYIGSGATRQKRLKLHPIGGFTLHALLSFDILAYTRENVAVTITGFSNRGIDVLVFTSRLSSHFTRATYISGTGKYKEPWSALCGANLRE